MRVWLETAIVRRDREGVVTSINVTLKGTEADGEPTIIHRYSIPPDGDGILKDWYKLEDTVIEHIQEVLKE
jgi:hypothetical protein